MTTRAAIYARVSRDEQRYNFSIPTQFDLGRRYCEEHGFDLADDRIFGDDYTGRRLDRPALTRLIDLVLAGGVDVVVVLDTSRLTRDQDHHGYLRTLFKQHRVRVAYVRQHVDDTPMGRAMLGMYCFKDEQEWVDTREKTINGLRAKVKSGKPIGRARAPFGLRYKPPILDVWGEPIKNTVNVAYEEDPSTIGHLRWMFSQADQGASLRSIAAGLDDLGVSPPYADRTRKRKLDNSPPRWNATSVRHILTNGCYVGQGVQYAVKVVEKADGSGKRRVKREVWDGEGDDTDKALPLPSGVFPQIVDGELFDRVQKRLAQNRRQVQRPDRDPEIGLLRRGIGRCGHCNSALVVRYGKGGAYYWCQTNQRRRHGCPAAAMNVDHLDRAAWASIEEARNDPLKAAEFAERLRRQDTDNRRAATMLAALDEHVADIDGRQANLIDNLALVTGEAAAGVAAKLQMLTDERTRLAELRSLFVERAKAEDERHRRIERVVAFFEGVGPTGGGFDDLSYQEKRRILLELGVVVRLFQESHRPRWDMRRAFGIDQSRVRAVGDPTFALAWVEASK